MQNKKTVCFKTLCKKSIACLRCECALTHLLATQDCENSDEGFKAEDVWSFWTIPPRPFLCTSHSALKPV